jgi:hypothetical protein
MEGNWKFKLNDQFHTVRASLPYSTRLSEHKLSIYFDDVLIYDQPRWGAVGELYRFERCGHMFAIKVHGWGHDGLWFLRKGELKLYLDDQDIDKPSIRVQANPSSRFKDNSGNQTLTIRIVETQRMLEPLGEEIREIDNSKSSIQIERKITTSREWSQSYTVDYENSGSLKGEMSVRLPPISEIKLNAERAIKERYSISESVKRVYSEEVTLTIPAKTKVQVFFSWKYIWQCGMIVINNPNNVEWKVPFRVRLEPTFDQRQVDQLG